MSDTPRPWSTLTLPRGLTRMRSMLSREELRYLVWLTAERYEGWGAIVDLGPWLGSSSAALAEGLDRTGKPGTIQSFDLWEWEPSYMEAVASEELPSGADFLPVFRREIGDYASRITAHKQDLMAYEWTGGPIEILFVDAAKSWELTNAIFRGFGAHLVPGRSRVVLQDFRYYETHWLPLIVDSRPDLWRELEGVADGTTVTFQPLQALQGPAGIRTDYSEESFPLATAEPLLRARLAREPKANHSMLLRSLYRKVLAEGKADAAQALRAELSAAGLTPREFESVERAWTILVPLGWKAYNRRDFLAARQLAERCFSDGEERPVYAVALLGMSRLQLGDLEGARRCIADVNARLPEFAPAKLYRAELALAEQRYRDAEADALAALRISRADEPHVPHALDVLRQSWAVAPRWTAILEDLRGLAGSLSGNPDFLTTLALVQDHCGERTAALRSLGAALDISPGHPGASALRAEWA